MIDWKNFVFAGVAIALIIAVLAPFLASSNPDGLESAFFGIAGAKQIQGSDLDEEKAGVAEEEISTVTGNRFAFESPFPDYTLGGLEKYGEALVIAGGTILVLAVAFGLSRIMSRTG